MKHFFLAILAAFCLTAYAQNDTLKVLCIGNSFTYFSDAPAMLKNIAESQSHTIIMTSATIGGYSMYRHLHDLNTIRVVEIPGYDCVFLQDQSQAHARFADNPKRWHYILDDTRELAERIRMYSADARIWLESTWAYSGVEYGGFGNMEHFDNLLRKGTAMIAKQCKLQISPIGKAFAIVRRDRPDINLYFEDLKHQSAYGTYLKSCINYLLIYKTPFHGEVYVGDLDAEKCQFLQSVAMQVVSAQ